MTAIDDGQSERLSCTVRDHSPVCLGNLLRHAMKIRTIRRRLVDTPKKEKTEKMSHLALVNARKLTLPHACSSYPHRVGCFASQHERPQKMTRRA